MARSTRKTTRPKPDVTMAPEHIAQASQLVYMDDFDASSSERFAPAHRASFSSGCAVMSLSVISVLTSWARISPPA